VAPSIRITEYTETELAQALDRSDSDYAVLSSEQPVIEPVLCDEASDLTRQSRRLRKTILNRVPVGQSSPKKTVGTREVFVRDATVVAYVLNEAKGICECCGLPGPFEKDDGEQYLEIHHVKHLAASGSDTTQNAIAACPNCHRELHFGVKKTELIEKLFANVERLVRE
jgi:5-methylcytosine-specific restriction protein A